jgi:hypothetical protein
MTVAGGAVRGGRAYLRRGLRIAGLDRWLYVAIVLLFGLPAGLAGYLAATVERPSAAQQASILALPWLTIVLGATVTMVSIGHHAQGRRVGLVRATGEGLLWGPRYLWTNLHTTLLFWTPIGVLLAARRWQEATLPAGAPVAAAWWALLGLVALGLHTRTLLAPFLAVHEDLPGTLAALESWRLTGRHFRICLATLVAGSLPVGLPAAAIGLWLWLALPEPDRGSLLRAGPDLAWIGIHALRPVLMPAVYVLHQDLWRAELARRSREGEPALPAPARALLALTRPLPNPARWRHPPLHRTSSSSAP